MDLQVVRDGEPRWSWAVPDMWRREVKGLEYAHPVVASEGVAMVLLTAATVQLSSSLSAQMVDSRRVMDVLERARAEQETADMIYQTLHSPHGTPLKPGSKGEWCCVKCPMRFTALCVYLEHQRKDHGEAR